MHDISMNVSGEHLRGILRHPVRRALSRAVATASGSMSRPRHGARRAAQIAIIPGNSRSRGPFPRRRCCLEPLQAQRVARWLRCRTRARSSTRLIASGWGVRQVGTIHKRAEIRIGPELFSISRPNSSSAALRSTVSRHCVPASRTRAGAGVGFGLDFAQRGEFHPGPGDGFAEPSKRALPSQSLARASSQLTDSGRHEQRIGEGADLLRFHFQDERSKRHAFDPYLGISRFFCCELRLEIMDVHPSLDDALSSRSSWLERMLVWMPSIAIRRVRLRMPPDACRGLP